MKKIEHIGLAVTDLNNSIQTFEKIFGESPYKTEEVKAESVIAAFFRVGPNKIELLQGVGTNNAISKFIEKRGEGIHHIAFEVSDIKAEMERLKDSGFRLLNDFPVQGADNKLICFIHPKSAHGVLIELCQEQL